MARREKAIPSTHGESRAVARQLFLHDPPPGLSHNCLPAPPEFGDQGGFAATRAAGDYDKSLYHAAAPTHPLLITNKFIPRFAMRTIN
jgi:hypothetical protein